MAGRFFDHDDFTGITERFHWNDDGTFTLEAIQDVEPALELAKASYNSKTGNERWNPLGEHVGFIPNVFLQRMILDGSLTDPKALERFFQENPGFKTRPWKGL